MSLILDALRKADSERERESVPGLHTQPMQPLSLDNAPAPKRTLPWHWIALGCVVVLGGALAAVLLGRAAAPVPRAAEPQATAIPPQATAIPPQATAPAGAMTNAAPPVVAVEPPRDIAPPAGWPDKKAQARPLPPAKADTPTVAPAVVPVATLPAVIPREQLPDAVRNGLPPLVVGGSIYSSVPASRSLILDGRLYRESDPITADLVVEEIGMKTAVLRARGYRFEIRY